MNLESFFEEDNTSLYNEKVDAETRKRIRVSVAACAYEVFDTSIISDFEFDELAKSIDLSINTRRPDLDQWFRKNFDPSTGMWIRTHPEFKRLQQLTLYLIRKNIFI